jgi:hypothetical protein|tara:strand:+ start:200 stop:409 length:210 start_codon:yes stop_codon:yes gene_type:complete
MDREKTFVIGELCVVPIPCLYGIQHAYGIIIKRNPLKLRSDFYSVFYNGKIKEHESLFIAKIEETQYES